LSSMTESSSSMNGVDNSAIVAVASRFIVDLYEYNSKLTGQTLILNQMEIQQYLIQYLAQVEQLGFKDQTKSVEYFNKRLSNLYKEEGNLYLKKKRYATAVDLYIASCLISPDNCIYYSNLSAALFFCKRYQESERACEFAILLDPSYSKAYSRMAKVKEKLNKFEEAIANYDKAIEMETSQSVKNTIIQQRDDLKKSMLNK